MDKKKNRYSQLVEKIFADHFKENDAEVTFTRDDIVKTAKILNIVLPKNLGDIVYSFRYRASLPESIRLKAPEGLEWVIRPVGTAK